jgi:soluble lytic murein transglycosylase-like protein
VCVWSRKLLSVKLLPAAVLGCWLALPPPASAQIYAWRDASGNLVLSDRPSPTALTYAVSTAAAHIRTTRPVAGAPAEAYDTLIRTHADANGLSPDLVRAIIQIESAFNPRAVSPKGAMGLMQLMPATATELGVLNPFDPAENIRAGATYFRQLLDRYDQKVELALAAYNAGPRAVDRHGQRVPPYRETQAYVRRIVSVTPISIGPRRTIYKIVELIDGREVPRYSDRKPDGSFKVVTRR